MSIRKIEREPVVSVGLMSGAKSVVFELKGAFVNSAGKRLDEGVYNAGPWINEVEIVSMDGWHDFSASEYRLTPVEPSASFIIHNVVIGIGFHWEQKMNQQFQGTLKIEFDAAEQRLAVIDEIPVEAYLTSVISSEMSANSHPELLKAHSITSRSWLLAQMEPWKKERHKPSFEIQTSGGEKRLIRWYDQESHAGFDVCADDHCQRYQGVTKATSATVHEAVRATSGQVLV
ncbi:MAG: SpoIID/LytB domain-containing protein, partial [Blastocatellia bacterium]